MLPLNLQRTQARILPDCRLSMEKSDATISSTWRSLSRAEDQDSCGIFISTVRYCLQLLTFIPSDRDPSFAIYDEVVEQSDITLICGEDKYLTTHRILCTRTNYFHELLRSSTTLPANVANIKLRSNSHILTSCVETTRTHHKTGKCL
jgi:hypothetical protein